MSENIAATLRNLVYNGADEATMHKAMLEAAGALDDMAAEYEKMSATYGENYLKMLEILSYAFFDMKHIVDTHMLCDCCEHLQDGCCGNEHGGNWNCWKWRGMGALLKHENG